MDYSEYILYHGRDEVPPVRADFLRTLISSDVRACECEGGVKLYLPWQLSRSVGTPSVPLCLTLFDDGKCIVISDGGRATLELSKKVGSLEAYSGRIRDLISEVGSYTLESGRIITHTFYERDGYFVRSAISNMLKIVTLISNLDLIPYTRGELRRMRGEGNGQI